MTHDYGFTHDGQVFTPDRTQGIDPTENDARNKAIERAELAHWQTAPDHQLAYYSFPAEHLPFFGKPRPYRESFAPCLHTFVEAKTPQDVGLAHQATVTTWLGTPLGTIIRARVYRHNFGGRFVSLTVQGSNGAIYHGRASYDWGQCITLKRRK